MVRTSAPSWLMANARHELMRRPSTMTVQAPHCPRSQPFLVPVSCRRSRRRSSSVTRGSSSSIVRFTPFTVSVVEMLIGCSKRVERDRPPADSDPRRSHGSSAEDPGQFDGPAHGETRRRLLDTDMVWQRVFVYIRRAPPL